MNTRQNGIVDLVVINVNPVRAVNRVNGDPGITRALNRHTFGNRVYNAYVVVDVYSIVRPFTAPQNLRV